MQKVGRQAPAGGSEKDGAQRVSENLVAVNAFHLKEVDLPDGAFFGMDWQDAIKLDYEVLLVVENMEPLQHIQRYGWLTGYIRGRRTRIHVAVQRLVALAHLLPLAVGKAIAVAPGDQLLSAELLQVLGIDLGQVHIAGGVDGRHAVLGHLRAFAQVVVELQLGNAAGHRKHLDAPAQLLATGGGIHRRRRADQRRTTGNPLDGHEPGFAHAAHEGIGLLGGVAGIQGNPCQAQLAATAVGPGFAHQLGQG